MGSFREHNKRQGNSNFRSGGKFGGNRFGDRDRSRGGFGGRNSGSRGGFGGERRSFDRPEMYDATCSKCGNECRVPFKPTGSKPVLCSSCFESQGNRHSGSDFSSKSSAAGMSQEQFKQLNEKLDKILAFLANLEIEVEGEEDLEDEDLDEDEE
ncbi:MAG TPA: CxxC-x17-CxxC domain-containing protein [Candidatus Nanoarchaeia archaeon]|nr:CxxC-x17-CxxC domain-containing protein [Candidatus Nanoarchaeia archaeon]